MRIIYYNMLCIMFCLMIFGQNKCFCQAIYKGFTYGMSEAEAKNEFKKNKQEYSSIDFGNGFVWRIFTQNFIYIDGKLAGIHFVPKGAALGYGHDNTIACLEFTKTFFAKKNYNVFLEPDSWQFPFLSKNSVYGLLMAAPDKSVMVHLFPSTYKINYNTVACPNMKVFPYNWFIDQYNKRDDTLQEKSDKSGF